MFNAVDAFCQIILHKGCNNLLGNFIRDKTCRGGLRKRPKKEAYNSRDNEGNLQAEAESWAAAWQWVSTPGRGWELDIQSPQNTGDL